MADYDPYQPPPATFDQSSKSPGQPPERPSFAQRHRIPLTVAAAVIVLGGAGVGIGYAATSGSDTTAGTPSSSGDPSAGASPAAQGGHKGRGGQGKATRGTIVSEAGSRWTVKTKQGKTSP